MDPLTTPFPYNHQLHAKILTSNQSSSEGHSDLRTHPASGAVHHTTMSESLYKHRSWSPDMCREEVWNRRKNRRRSKSVTDEDLDELKACIELGFGFDSPDVDQRLRLSNTLPALQLLYVVNNHYSKSTSSESTASSPLASPHSFFVPGKGDNTETTKARLRQWAQVVACSVRQCSFP